MNSKILTIAEKKEANRVKKQRHLDKIKAEGKKKTDEVKNKPDDKKKTEKERTTKNI